MTESAKLYMSDYCTGRASFRRFELAGRIFLCKRPF